MQLYILRRYIMQPCRFADFSEPGTNDAFSIVGSMGIMTIIHHLFPIMHPYTGIYRNRNPADETNTQREFTTVTSPDFFQAMFGKKCSGQDSSELSNPAAFQGRMCLLKFSQPNFRAISGQSGEANFALISEVAARTLLPNVPLCFSRSLIWNHRFSAAQGR